MISNKNNVFWVGGQTEEWIDRKGNLPTDQVNEVSQYLKPRRVEGTDEEENSHTATGLEFACRFSMDLTPLPRIQPSVGQP